MNASFAPVVALIAALLLLAWLAMATAGEDRPR